MTRWCVSNANILDAKADGLICSANPNLNLSGGVGGAFLLRYGTEMQDFLYGQLRTTGRRFIEPGNSVTAPPCGSPYKAIAHAVAIDAFYDTNCDFIRAGYSNAISQLTAASCRTIVAACLACGYGRCSIADFIEAIEPLIAKPYPNVDTVTLVTTNNELADAIVRSLSLESPLAPLYNGAEEDTDV
ncbi:MAG: macro domain-containing protein [Planctomycetales bacterium]|nr:macro domain-containing protein [Planctomycetales bacterium]